MLIRGDHLGLKLKNEVLSAYVHRWTIENAKHTYGGRCPGCAQIGRFPYRTGSKTTGFKTWTEKQWHAYHVPLISDEAWLAQNAFYVTKQGELDLRYQRCEPACLA